jgi:hypothetical protein
MVSDRTRCEAKLLGEGVWELPLLRLRTHEAQAAAVMELAEAAERLRRRADRVGLLPEHLELLLGLGGDSR